MKWKIPLYRITTDDEDFKNIKKVLQRKMDWAIGPEIPEFEKRIAKYVGTKFCTAFNSGTSAGHAALLVAEINSGNIIVPSFTFIATSNWPLMVNSKPKFSDIEEKNFGLDPQKLNSSITKTTKAVIPIHYGGLACKIDEISEICKKKKILLVEDCAEALGAKFKGKHVGNFGEMSIFSFAPNKIITTGEGGAVCTNSEKFYKKLQLIRSYGRLRNHKYFKTNEQPNYVSLGYNWRMSSMTAALGLSQFDKIEKIIQSRRSHAKYFSNKLKKIQKIKLPSEPKQQKHVYQLYTIRLENSKIRSDLQRFLSKHGIMTKVFFDPVHRYNFYKKHKIKQNDSLPVTKLISNQALSLPLFPGLKSEEIRYICDSIQEFFEN